MTEAAASAPGATKVLSMRDAIARYVHDGDTVVIEGFTHLICFAAGHEIIRQKRRDLVLCRLTPDLIYDQLIAAGCARKGQALCRMLVALEVERRASDLFEPLRHPA